MKQTIKLFAAFVVALFATVSAFAQGTTSSMSGVVSDESGAPLVGATVVAVHTPSGSQYYSVAGNNGNFTINGMRPGGPYTVTISLIGCQTVMYTDLTLKLGEMSVIDATLKEDKELLEEAVVIADAASRFSTEKTGASTNVSNSEMMNLPNSSRSISSIAQLSPYSNGMSFAGGDGRSTNFKVDGANFNNNFGLTSKLPGGGSPISLDALEEMQIVVAPYDVRETNFVGGGINAVTKSGTNTFKGTAYAYYSDEGFRGNKLDGESLGAREFEQNKTYGFTLGGPIIKNKLFFFVNFESTKNPAQVIEERPDAAKQVVLQKISDKLQKDYGYNPGSFMNFPGGIENMKILARLDWNISDAHKLSVRFNKTDSQEWSAPNGNSTDDGLRNRSYNRASSVSHPFSSSMFSYMGNVMSVAGELNSRFTTTFANRLLVTYTNINDQRGSKSDIFPHIDIMSGDMSSGNYIPYTALGYELFSYNNGVLNNNIQVQDDATLYLGNHTVTIGARFEFMDALNSYMRNGTGYYRYASADDFLNGNLPLSFCVTYGYDGNDKPAGEVKYNQYAIYAQDDWKITRNFKLSYGIRGEYIAFNEDAIVTNPNIAAIDYGGRSIDTGKWPKGRPQISPRVGFNWDIKGDKSLVLRGGLGLFQGRLPLVFFTNMPQYSGMIQGSYVVSPTLKDGELVYAEGVKETLAKVTPGGKILTNVSDMVKALGLPTSPSSESAGLGGNSYISGVDTDFRMPQLMKTSLAVDYNVPVNFPFSITAEAMYNKTIWGIMMEDWSLNTEGAELKKFSGADNRYMNLNASRYHSRNAYVLTNTHKGYGYTANITMNMQPARNLKLMAAYTHTESKELSGLPGSAANSVFTALPTVNGANLTTLQRSTYVVPDKIIASVSYTIPSQGLHFNLFYSGSSAFGNSFIYSNDMNGDGNAVDLIYIPKDANEISFKTPADAAAFMTFVDNDKYLSRHKGEYAEAHAARAPFVNRFDLSIVKDFTFNIGKTKHNIQLSASLDNVSNLLNSNWGTRKLSVYEKNDFTGNIAVLKYEGVNDAGVPSFSMNKVNGEYPTKNYKTFTNTDECWHALIGIKYFFN
ncbi:MAG: TonB-dependent receptor [Bacteroidales bacterium]|nr:TonB-dependent receptor [Bacteroidales bacterium]